MAESEKFNRCVNHPENPKEFVCEVCKTIYCSACYKADTKHRQKISALSETLMENYEFERYLGGGTFGKVYKVRNLSDGQELALKVMQDVDEETFLSVKKEAQFLCSLNHKHLVKYTYSYRIKEEELFIILMELAEGCLIDKIPTMKQEEAFKYFKQICSGLHYLHVDLGIVHRDLKPGNILMKGEDCKICDLGEAKKMTKEFTKLTNSQGFGTEAYLPPEVLNGKDYSFKADIWAMGIIFHKMLANNAHPFNPTNDKNCDIRQSTLSKNMTISPEIKDPLYLKLLQGCLEYEEKDRFSIKQIMEIIKEAEEPNELPKVEAQIPLEKKRTEPVPNSREKIQKKESNSQSPPTKNIPKTKTSPNKIFENNQPDYSQGFGIGNPMNMGGFAGFQQPMGGGFDNMNQGFGMGGFGGGMNLGGMIGGLTNQLQNHSLNTMKNMQNLNQGMLGRFNPNINQNAGYQNEDDENNDEKEEPDDNQDNNNIDQNTYGFNPNQNQNMFGFVQNPFGFNNLGYSNNNNSNNNQTNNSRGSKPYYKPFNKG